MHGLLQDLGAMQVLEDFRSDLILQAKHHEDLLTDSRRALIHLPDNAVLTILKRLSEIATMEYQVSRDTGEVIIHHIQNATGHVEADVVHLVNLIL